MPLARAARPSSKAGRSCRRRNNSSNSRSPGRSSKGNSSSSNGGGGSGSSGSRRGVRGDSKKEDSKAQACERYRCSSSGVLGAAPPPPQGRWPPRSSQPRPSRCLDALLRENVLLAVLPFLEAADATRFGACCTDLHTALTTPRVQPLWRRWFETSGFVWWPYGGACGSSCSLQIDRDGFVLQQERQQGQQQPQLQLMGLDSRPGTGYRHFSHEGWCCQFLWNARSLHNWKSGTCAFAALQTDSHKLFMVSIHPKGLYASRAEAMPLSPVAALTLQQTVESPAADTPRHARQSQQRQQQQRQEEQDDQGSPTAAPLQQQAVRSPAAETQRQTYQHHRQQQEQQQQQLQQQQQQQQQDPHPQPQQQLLNNLDDASASRLTDSEGSLQPSVHFAHGAGRYLRAALHAKPAVLTAAADRVVCITEPLKKGTIAPSTSSPSNSDGPHGSSTSSCYHRSGKGAPAVSVSPVSAYAAAGSISSLASLELELESLVSGGGGGRRGSGRTKKNGGSRHAAASATAAAYAAGVGGSGEPRRASGDAAAATAAAAAGDVREICRCWPRGAWLGCSVDAASGLMACSHRSTEATSNAGRGRRKKGNSGGGAAEACEYKVFDLLQETELAQLAIEGQLVHRLILNFIFSQNPSRVFGFDRWHREFFVWTISNAVPGEALETSAIVNAHTDGILGLDVTETYSSLKVLSGSRDETISLYSVDPLLRLSTFSGHQAEVSAVCWLRNGEAAPSGQQCRPEQMAQGVYTVADAPGVYTAKGAYTDDEIQLFASGAYNGTIKIWDARQADPKSLSGNGLTLLEHQNRITRLATAWDGRMLLSGDSEGVVKLWDLRKCADSILTAKYNGAILDLHANRAFCVVRSSPSRGRDTVHVLDFCGRPS